MFDWLQLRDPRFLLSGLEILATLLSQVFYPDILLVSGSRHDVFVVPPFS